MNKTFMEALNLVEPEKTAIMLLVIWFGFGTWFRYATDTPLLGVFGWRFNMKY